MHDALKKERNTLEEIYVAARRKELNRLEDIVTAIIETTSELTTITNLDSVHVETLNGINKQYLSNQKDNLLMAFKMLSVSSIF